MIGRAAWDACRGVGTEDNFDADHASPTMHRSRISLIYPSYIRDPLICPYIRSYQPDTAPHHSVLPYQPDTAPDTGARAAADWMDRPRLAVGRLARQQREPRRGRRSMHGDGPAAAPRPQRRQVAVAATARHVELRRVAVTRLGAATAAMVAAEARSAGGRLAGCRAEVTSGGLGCIEEDSSASHGGLSLRRVAGAAGAAGVAAPNSGPLPSALSTASASSMIVQGDWAVERREQRAQ